MDGEAFAPQSPITVISAPAPSRSEVLRKGGFAVIFLGSLFLLVLLVVLLDYTGVLITVNVEQYFATQPILIPAGFANRRFVLEVDDSQVLIHCTECGYAGSELILPRANTAIGVNRHRVVLRSAYRDPLTESICIVSDYQDRQSLLGLFVDTNGAIRMDATFDESKRLQPPYQWQLFEVKQSKTTVDLPRYALYSRTSAASLPLFLTFQTNASIGLLESPYSTLKRFQTSLGTNQHFRLRDQPAFDPPEWSGTPNIQFRLRAAATASTTTTTYLGAASTGNGALLQLLTSQAVTPSVPTPPNLEATTFRFAASTIGPSSGCWLIGKTVSATDRSIVCQDSDKSSTGALILRFSNSLLTDTRRLLRFLATPNRTDSSVIIEVLPSRSDGLAYEPTETFGFGMYMTLITDAIGTLIPQPFLSIQSDASLATRFLLETI
jgi:hypothetical protein